jgi:hypothetical protein
MHVPSVATRACVPSHDAGGLRDRPRRWGSAGPCRGPGSAFAIEALQAGTAQMQRASTALKKTSRRFVSRLPT